MIICPPAAGGRRILAGTNDDLRPKLTNKTESSEISVSVSQQYLKGLGGYILKLKYVP